MAEMYNAHLLDVADTGVDAVIVLPNTKGFVISAGGSGYVPGGCYELEVRTAAVVNKKEGKQGKNVRVESRIAGPKEFAGVAIVENIPAPVGKPGDNTFDTGWRKLVGMHHSIASGLGKLTEVQEQETLKLNCKWLTGKKWYAHLKDGKADEKGVVRAEVDRAATKDEYEANPGPVGGEMISDAAPRSGRTQTSAPEIAPRGNGAQAPASPGRTTSPSASKDLDSALGIG